MKSRGHWFCERCQEVIHLRADETEPARCPSCNRDSAVFIPALADSRPVTVEAGQTRFAELRQAITEPI